MTSLGTKKDSHTFDIIILPQCHFFVSYLIDNQLGYSRNPYTYKLHTKSPSAAALGISNPTELVTAYTLIYQYKNVVITCNNFEYNMNDIVNIVDKNVNCHCSITFNSSYL